MNLPHWISIENLDKLIGLALIVVLVFFLLKYKFIEYAERRKQKKRFKRGADLENDAKQFLKDKGYKIVDDQSVYYHKFKENGKSVQSQLKVDYVVRKSGKKYLVEVKSGKSAINISNKSTRRQILEYDYAIENDGIFLLDMENKVMKLIQFTPKAEKSKLKLIHFVIVLALIGIFIPYMLVKGILAFILLIIWLSPKYFR